MTKISTKRTTTLGRLSPHTKPTIAFKGADGSTLQIPTDRPLSDSRIVLPPHPANAKFLAANGVYWVSPKDRFFRDNPDFQIYVTQAELQNEKLRGNGKIFIPEAVDPTVFNTRGKIPIIGNTLNRAELSPLIDPSDLNNLLFLSSAEVKRVLFELESVAQKQDSGRTVNLIFGYGGTIASVEKVINGISTLVPGLSSSYLIGSAGHKAEERFAVVTSQFPSLLDSSQMRGVFLRDFLVMLCYIHKNGSDLLKSKLGGVIVPHGTDTLEWSAAKFAFQAGPDLPFPVIFVSSQHSLNKRGAEGPANILLSLESAEKLMHEGHRLVLSFVGGHKGGALFGAGLRKVSDTSVMSHTADGYSMVVDSDNMTAPISFPFTNSYKRSGRGTRIWRPVVIQSFLEEGDFSLKVSQDQSPSYVANKIASTKLPIAHLICFGSHTAPFSTVKAAITAAKESGKALIVSNIIAGALGEHNYQASVWLDQSGSIRLGMTPHGISAKLSLALELYGSSKAALPNILKFLTRNDYVGEQLPHPSRPDRSPLEGVSLGTDGLDDVLPPLP